MPTIDLNADLGEGFGRWSLTDDAALLDVVTSANVACGFHAGDPGIMRRACRLAAERGVAIGAQVSYRDLAGFGRRFIDVSPADLEADVTYQIGALDAFARAAGTRVRFVKPHGALYNTVVHHEAQAGALVSAVRAYAEPLALVGLPGSRSLELARAAGLVTVTEGFVDRGYTPAGTLVPRGEPGALLPLEDALARVAELAAGRVRSADGIPIEVEVRTLCVHGDSPGAVELARAVRERLIENGFRLEPAVRI